jgi:hypothetical protein
MALLIYHHHTVVSTPIYDNATGRWKFTVSITWPQTRSVTRGLHFLTTPELFVRFEDAENTGIEAAKNWVESKAAKPLGALI